MVSIVSTDVFNPRQEVIQELDTENEIILLAGTKVCERTLHLDL